MDIYFDNIIFSIQKFGGISVVWEELLKRVLTNNQLNASFIEYKGEKNINRNRLDIPKDKIITKNKSLFRLKRYLDPYIIKKDKYIFHSSYYRIANHINAINITTVHDFTYEYYCSGLQKRIHCYQKYRAIRKSDFIICISENTKKDLLRFLPEIDSNKIRVVYNGVSDDYYPFKKKVFLPYSVRTYVLFIGSREIYKNFDLAVKAIAASNLNMIIVGNSLSKKEKLFLNSSLGKKRFKYLGHVLNQELNKLYNYAHSFLYPSSYEGFGIPVLEAQKAGCPVIAYNSSSIPEIIGNTPLLINELSTKAIIECFNILKNKEARNKIIKQGILNAKRFNWDNMYKQLAQIYNEAWRINQ